MKRKVFTPFDSPEKAIEMARAKNPHHPHSIAVLALTHRATHIAVGEPESARNNGAQVMVPPQERFVGNENAASALRSAQKLADSFLTHDVKINSLKYLGYGFGNQHLPQGRIRRQVKYVHVFAHIVPSDIRKSGLNGLLRDTPSFSEVQWLRFDDILSLHAGGIMSDEKTRMVMQALCVLCAQNRSMSESKAAQLAGRTLGQQLTPRVA